MELNILKPKEFEMEFEDEIRMLCNRMQDHKLNEISGYIRTAKGDQFVYEIKKNNGKMFR